MKLGAVALCAAVALLRRSRHVQTENRRVLDTPEALATADLERLGVLMAASHASMRDEVEITVPVMDERVDILQQSIDSAGGARMTGGGFGGCAVALLPRHKVVAARAAVAHHYRSPEGLPANIYLCRASAGAGLP